MLLICNSGYIPDHPGNHGDLILTTEAVTTEQNEWDIVHEILTVTFTMGNNQGRFQDSLI